MDGAFISEEAGAAKPNPAYYDYVRRQIPAISPDNTLTVGDSLATDIRAPTMPDCPPAGSIPKASPGPTGIRIDYEIRDLRELLDIV